MQELLAVALPAGLLAGTIAGIVARAMMRVFAIADGMERRFTVYGSVGVVVIFAVVFGAPLALLYYRFWHEVSIPGDLHGLSFGALIFLIFIAIPFMVIPSDEATLRLRLIAIGSFLPVPLIYGIALALIVDRLLATA